jgi:mRNA interferase HigB
MNIINRKQYFTYSKIPKSKNQLLKWFNEILKQEFEGFRQLKMFFGNASIINNERVVSNIKGNKFRLIISINFTRALICLVSDGKLR